MQYLLIDKKDTLASISKVVGSQNIDALLTENGLIRAPRIGQQWADKCEDLIESGVAEVTPARKATLLNSLTGSEDVFEKACMMDEDEWKVFSAFGSFTDTLKVPETIKLPNSAKVIGEVIGNNVLIGDRVSASGASSGRNTDNRYGERASSNGSYPSGSYSGSNDMSAVTGSSIDGRVASSNPVNANTYKAVMNNLKSTGSIDPGVFNTVNTSPAPVSSGGATSGGSSTPVAFDLPWGKIQIYSSLLDQVMDIPAYPEELDTSRLANYTTMPDIIYQYEPWPLYQSSGPREQEVKFHLHRDMWTGNHMDGKANELIRFCEANTFPRYSGSAVLAPTVKIYISGKTFVSGILTQCRTHWSGPIGQDDWYLEFELSLTIQEISETALNIDSVSKFELIGG